MPVLPVGDRGLSPVIGGVLLVAVVVTLGVVAGSMVLDLGQEREPAPEVVLTLETEDGETVHWLTHEQGKRLNGEQVTLKGTADPDALSGTELVAGERVPVYPTADVVTVVWTGEHDASYVLRELDAEQVVPDPDEGCDWVDAETNGGVDDITIDGTVVACDVETDKVITVRNGGVVVGETTSDTKVLDADGAAFYGDVSVEDTLNLQDSEVVGTAESRTADVKLDNGTVGGSVSAADEVELADASSIDGSLTADDEIEVLDGSSVAGDVESDDELVKVLNSDVSGSVATDEDVKLDGATVEGDVYVGGSFDCASSTIDGQDCGDYTPEDADDR